MHTTHAHHRSGSSRARASGWWRRVAAGVSALALAAGLAVTIAATPAAATGGVRYVDAVNGADTTDCGTSGGSAACKTIQQAITNAAAGDTVSVASGTYTPDVPILVNKAITLQGAASVTDSTVGAPDGAPTITPAAGTAALTVSAPGATIAGLDITDVQGSSSSLGFGVVVKQAANNTTVANNTISGVTTATTQTQSFGVYLEGGPSDVTVSRNTIQDITGSTTVAGVFIGDSTATTASNGVKITGNTITGITSASKGAYGIELNNKTGAGNLAVANNTITGIASTNGWVHAIGIEAPAPSLSITGNTISTLSGSATDTVAVWFESEDTATDTPTVTNNSFNSLGANAKAIAVQDPMGTTHFSTVNAALNYWGSASPTFKTLVTLPTDITVTKEPYYTDSAMLVPSNQTTTDVTSDNSPVPVTSASVPVQVNIAAGVTGGGVLYTVSSGTASSVPQTTINTADGTSVVIPASTTITATGTDPSTWDGVVSAPAAVTPPADALPSGSAGVVAVSVGSSSLSLTFSTPVRLLLPGQAGKNAGFIDNTGKFTAIGLTCTADSLLQVTAQLTAGQACAIPVGADLAIWTTHFTTFVTYTMPSVGGGGGGSTPPPTAGQTDRIAGADRYATAAKIAEQFGPASAIVIANGIDAKQGVDALSANFLAGKVGAPILLVQTGSVSADTLAAVKVVLAGASSPTIYVTGGVDSVSDSAVATIKAAAQTVSTGTVSVKRIAGADRYATSAAATAAGQGAAAVSFASGSTPQTTAILASGQVNADALAAGALSNAWGIPVLLTTRDQLPPAVVKAITVGKITQLLVLGGPDRISQTVLDQASAAGVKSVERVAGPDRFATAAELYTFAFDMMTDSSGNHYGATKDGTVYLANGLSGFPDALAVGPLAGSTGGALLTAGTGVLSTAAGTFLSGHATAFTAVTALGQPATLSTAVLQAAANLL